MMSDNTINEPMTAASICPHPMVMSQGNEDAQKVSKATPNRHRT